MDSSRTATSWAPHALVRLTLSAIAFFVGSRGRRSPPVNADDLETVPSISQPSATSKPIRQHHVDTDCPRELAAQVAELERVLLDVAACRAERSTWPEDLDDVWQPGVFQSAVTSTLDKLGVVGEVTFDCLEFPCLARLPDGSDQHQIQAALEDYYKSEHGVTPNAYSEGWETVGGWGSRALRYVSILPPEAGAEVRERLVARTQDLIQAQTKRLRREAIEAELAEVGD